MIEAESGNDKRFPRRPTRTPKQSGRPAARKRDLPRRCWTDGPSAAADPAADRPALAGFAPAAELASRSAVLSVPAFPALASRRRGPHRKAKITRSPLQASHARIAPVAIDGDSSLRGLAQEKSRLECGSGRLSSSLRAVIGFPACTA